MSLYNLYKQSELHTGLEITLFKSGEGVIILCEGVVCFFSSPFCV